MISFKTMVWHLLLFAVSFSISTSTAFPRKDSELISRDECKGERLYATKPEGNKNVEMKINSSVADLPTEGYSDKEVVPGVQKKRRSIDVVKQNCAEEVRLEFRYNYMTNRSSYNDIIARSPYLRELIEIVKCGPLPWPLSSDSDQECFNDLIDDSKSTYCKTIYSNRIQIFQDERNKTYYSGEFVIPVACACTVSLK